MDNRKRKQRAERGRRLGAAWIVVAGALLACGPGGRTASESIEPFLEAVQTEDVESLYCLLAGASGSGGPEDEDPVRRRADFDGWARAQYEAYEVGRDAGRVELEGDGIRTVKLFALGRGTFYSYGPVKRIAGNALAVSQHLLFGYSHIDLSRFSPGTTFYLNGLPPGRVAALRVPSGARELSADVLERITVEWTLIEEPAVGGCPAGWKIAGVTPVSGTGSSREIAWLF